MAPIWSDAVAEAKWERERRNRSAGDLLFGVNDPTPPKPVGRPNEAGRPGRSTRADLLRRLEEAHNARLLRDLAAEFDDVPVPPAAAADFTDDMLRWVDELGNRVEEDTRTFLRRDRYALLAPPEARRLRRELALGLPPWRGPESMIGRPDRNAGERDWFDPNVAWFDTVPGGANVGTAEAEREADRHDTGGGAAARRPCGACSGPVEVDIIDLAGGTVHVTCPHCGTRDERRYLA